MLGQSCLNKWIWVPTQKYFLPITTEFTASQCAAKAEKSVSRYGRFSYHIQIFPCLKVPLSFLPRMETRNLRLHWDSAVSPPVLRSPSPFAEQELPKVAFPYPPLTVTDITHVSGTMIVLKNRSFSSWDLRIQQRCWISKYFCKKNRRVGNERDIKDETETQQRIQSSEHRCTLRSTQELNTRADSGTKTGFTT